MSKPWLGLGTGRSGTQSLAGIFEAYHEDPMVEWGATLDWYDFFDPDGQSLGGLVGLDYVGPVHRIRALWEENKPCEDDGLPVVCLHRDKTAVVDSFLRMHNGLDRLTEYGRKHVAVPEMNQRFPELTWAVESEDAWGIWWEICEAIMWQIPEPVFHINTDQLNDAAKLQELANWLKHYDCLPEGWSLPNKTRYDQYSHRR